MNPEQLEQAWAAGQIVPLVAAAEAESLAAAWGDADPAAVQQELARCHGPGVIVGSGGSSGARRWCLQPLTHLQASAQATATWLEQLGLDPAGCQILNPLPPQHVSGLLPWVRARQWGARHRRLDPGLLRDGAALAAAWPALQLRQQGPALLSLVPTQLRRLLSQPQAVAWLQQLAVIWLGGAPLPPELAAHARALRLPLAPCYGSTETAAMVAALAPERFLAGETGCGQPLGDVALRVDASSGALEITTARLSPGWLEQGQLQPVVNTADGWWRSADAARLDAAGLHIVGRLDGAIHSGGETVFPEQVEQRLRALLTAAGLPIAELLLLGQDDAEWGQRLVALFRLEGPHQAPDRRWSEQLAAVARQLPPSQRPLAWWPCPDLAPTAAGKWQRDHWQSWLQRAKSGATAGQA
jgi:O-succinylbenzoic acid--CoA ligase